MKRRRVKKATGKPETKKMEIDAVKSAEINLMKASVSFLRRAGIRPSHEKHGN
jgi:hypothetical protein